MRVLLDTNVLVSYLLAPNESASVVRVMNAAFEQKFTLLVSDQLVEETRTVIIERPRLAKRIAAARIGPLVADVLEIGERIDVGGIEMPRFVRDRKDDYLIVLAMLGDADVLVTGDRDLLELDLPLPFRIMSMSDFLAEIETE